MVPEGSSTGVTTFTFDQRIERAAELAKTSVSAGNLLELYARLARFQKRIFEEIAAREDTDVRALARYYPPLVDLLGPDLMGHPTANLLVDCWEGRPPADQAACLLARVLLQPFAEYLATRRQIDPNWSQAVCPLCSSRPAIAVLRGEGDGAKRWLLCALCAAEWPYRRVVCHHCGEENKDQLPVFAADVFEFVHIYACESCKTYIKAIDLTRNGLAVPMVDEIATISLNIWAEEKGFTKLEPNVLGM